MKRVSEDKLYKGDLYKCTSYPTVAGSYFGVTYEEQLIQNGLSFVQLRDGSFAELEDYKANGKKAARLGTTAKTAGDYFVKDLTPLAKEIEQEPSV